MALTTFYMTILHSFLSITTLGIGSYMVFTYAGTALPPTLSGIAFISIGLSQLLEHIRSR